jgi:hypothetical protein
MDQIQTAHSLGVGSVRNPDGTITVRCRLCGNAITDIDGRNKFHSATCAICEAEERGVIVPPEIEAMLRTVRMPDGNRLPMAVIAPTPQPDPMVGFEPKVGRPEFFFRVLRQAVNVVKAVAEELPKTVKKAYKEKTAQDIANEKRHKPLFQGGVEINIKQRK